ncbi:unnamed protein product [Cochlearia groenlandica]
MCRLVACSGISVPAWLSTLPGLLLFHYCFFVRLWEKVCVLPSVDFLRFKRSIPTLGSRVTSLVFIFCTRRITLSFQSSYFVPPMPVILGVLPADTLILEMELGICFETLSLRATHCHYSEAYGDLVPRKALFPGQD